MTPTSEVLWGDRIPQHVLMPDYWKPHNFEDNCEWEENSVTDYESFSRSIKVFNRLSDKLWRASYRFANDFWEKKTSVALSEFRSGSTFDARLHNLGTIIREESETIHATSNDPFYYGITLIGVVCEVEIEDELQRAIAKYHETRRKTLSLLSFGGPIIEVGAVEHTRIKPGFPDKITEWMSRVTKVEILQAGAGESQQSKSKGIQVPRFRFSPQRAFS